MPKKIKIAVPENPVFDFFIQNKDLINNKYELQVIRASEKKCAELLLTDKVNAALLSPLGYGMGMLDSEFRIVPESVLAYAGWSGIASIHFNKGLGTIKTIAASEPDDFLIKMGILVLSERYDILPKIIDIKGSVNDLLKQADAVVAWNTETSSSSALDITEEWFDAFEIALPIAFWVCRDSGQTENLAEIIKALPDKNYKGNPMFKDYVTEGEVLISEWNDDIENSLDQVLQFLYFHQFFSDVPAVKVLGRESVLPI